MTLLEDLKKLVETLEQKSRMDMLMPAARSQAAVDAISIRLLIGRYEKDYLVLEEEWEQDE